MRAIWKGTVIADSDLTIDVHGYPYFPRDKVRMELLRPAPKDASDLECPHGVQFYDLVNGDISYERAAWSYEKPGDAMMSIGHWIGFWGDDVELR